MSNPGWRKWKPWVSFDWGNYGWELVIYQHTDYNPVIVVARYNGKWHLEFFSDYFYERLLRMKYGREFLITAEEGTDEDLAEKADVRLRQLEACCETVRRCADAGVISWNTAQKIISEMCRRPMELPASEEWDTSRSR